MLPVKCQMSRHVGLCYAVRGPLDQGIIFYGESVTFNGSMCKDS